MGNIELSQMELVEDDFFVGNPVHLSLSLEGQGLTGDGEYLLGCREGPEMSLTNLLHEMAHLADRSIPKLLEYPTCGWGYISGAAWYINGMSGVEPQNSEGAMTEIRCYAYQVCLINEYMRELDFNGLYDLVKPIRFLPCFDLFKEETKTNKDEDTILLVASWVKTLSLTTHRIKNFRNAWKKRMAALKANPKS